MIYLVDSVIHFLNNQALVLHVCPSWDNEDERVREWILFKSSHCEGGWVTHSLLNTLSYKNFYLHIGFVKLFKTSKISWLLAENGWKYILPFTRHRWTVWKRFHSYHLYKMTFPNEHNKKIELPLSKQNGIWVEKFLPLNNRSQLNVKSVGQLHRRPATTILGGFILA